MTIGDTVEWKGVNKSHSGIITEGDNGELYVDMGNGHSFPLSVIRNSRSIHVTHHQQDIRHPQSQDR